MSLESGDKNNEVKDDQEVERQQEIQQQEEAQKNAETKRRGSELDDKQDLDSTKKNEVDEDSEKDKEDPEKDKEDPEKDKEDPEKKNEDPEKHNMSELPENAEIVDASKIDMTDARGMDDEHFWEHHGNTKEDYMRIAEHIPDVQKELDSGMQKILFLQ